MASRYLCGVVLDCNPQDPVEIFRRPDTFMTPTSSSQTEVRHGWRDLEGVSMPLRNYRVIALMQRLETASSLEGATKPLRPSPTLLPHRVARCVEILKVSQYLCYAHASYATAARS